VKQLCLLVDDLESLWTDLYLCGLSCISVNRPVFCRQIRILWTDPYLCGQFGIFVDKRLSCGQICSFSGRLCIPVDEIVFLQTIFLSFLTIEQRSCVDDSYFRSTIFFSIFL